MIEQSVSRGAENRFLKTTSGKPRGLENTQGVLVIRSLPGHPDQEHFPFGILAAGRKRGHV